MVLETNVELTLFLFCQVYEPVEEGSYIKMIDMVSGNGGQIQVRLYLFLFKKLAFHMAIPSSLNLEMKLDSFDSS